MKHKIADVTAQSVLSSTIKSPSHLKKWFKTISTILNQTVHLINYFRAVLKTRTGSYNRQGAQRFISRKRLFFNYHLRMEHTLGSGISNFKPAKVIAPSQQQHGLKLMHLLSKMRKTLSQLVLHRGDKTIFVEGKSHLFMLYQKNIRATCRTMILKRLYSMKAYMPHCMRGGRVTAPG